MEAESRNLSLEKPLALSEMDMDELEVDVVSPSTMSLPHLTCFFCLWIQFWFVLYCRSKITLVI
jgi:hypothetical protein